MISPKKETNIGELLKKALTKLHQDDHFDEYMRYLNAEWYYTPDDLRRAREDERVWAELKFPGRLKVEISALLDESIVEPADESHEVSSKVQFSEEANTTSTFEIAAPDIEEAEYNSWVKCWAPEHECYYFYNTITQASSWEDPYGADETAVYDVYQYNEETQEWTVIEDNTSGSNYDVDADGNYLSAYDTAESKNPGSGKAFEDKQSSSFEGATFTRPRDPNSEADVLFTMSPNRPGAKGSSALRGESKAHYRYSGRGGAVGGRGIPSPSGSPVPVRKNKPKPVRLDVAHLSDDSGSDKESPAKPRSGEKSRAAAVAGAAVLGATAASGVKSGSGNKKLESKQEFSYVTPRPEENGAPERHRSSSLDSDVEYPVRHVNGIYTTTPPNEEVQPTTTYTQGTYNEDGTYTEYPDAAYTQEENDAYYNNYEYEYNDPSSKSYYDPNTDTYYTNPESKDSDDADPDYYLSAAQGGVQSSKFAGYDKSNKSNATRSSKFSEYGYEGDYSAAASSKREEEVLEESFYHHAAEPTAPATPLPDTANKYTSHSTKYANNSRNSAGALHRTSSGSPTEDVHIIGLPVVAPSPQLYSPNGRTRRYSADEKSDSRSTSVTYATPVRADDPTSCEENYFYAASVEDFPITPGGSNNLALLQVAMGTPVTPHTPSNAQSPQPMHTKTKQRSTLGKLFHMNLFSKGAKVPSTPPPPRDNRSDNNPTAATNPHSSAYRQARQEERRSNKNNSRKTDDIVITADTNSSTNKGNKMRPFPSTSTSNSQNNNTNNNTNTNTTSDKTSNYNNPTNRHNAITTESPHHHTGTHDYYTNAHTGDRQDLGMRRKPVPAPADSAASMASNDKFYEQHGNERQYKYQNKQRQMNDSSAGTNRKPTSALQEEVHLQNLQRLMDMGFEEGESIMALNMCEDNLTEATQMLVESKG